MKSEKWGSPQLAPKFVTQGMWKLWGLLFSANVKVEKPITSPFPNPTFIPGSLKGHRKRVYDFLYSLSVWMHTDVIQLWICTKASDFTCISQHCQISHYFCTRFMITCGLSYFLQVCDWDSKPSFYSFVIKWVVYPKELPSKARKFCFKITDCFLKLWLFWSAVSWF